MASRMTILEEALRRVPHQYSNRTRLQQDVAVLLETSETLVPKTETFSRGSWSATIFHLKGTVPILFRGSQYNIPVTIYFDPPYPEVPPRIFVTPTEGMSLKSNHRSVHMSGAVYSPYLVAWTPRTSSLTALLEIVATTFSADPPVYAVARPALAGPEGGGCLTQLLGIIALTSSAVPRAGARAASRAQVAADAAASRPPERRAEASRPAEAPTGGDERLSGAGTGEGLVEGEGPAEGEACSVCLTSARTHAFVPCGHRCVCGACLEELLARGGGAACPICRVVARSAIRIYS